jgi:acyl carrier protein
LQGTSDLIADKVEGISLQFSVMREIRRCLAPYQFGTKEIAGDTVISDGVTIDSLTLMDMIMELEDRFSVYIPMSVVAEIRTVDQLAGTILRLHGRR